FNASESITDITIEMFIDHYLDVRIDYEQPCRADRIIITEISEKSIIAFDSNGDIIGRIVFRWIAAVGFFPDDRSCTIDPHGKIFFFILDRCMSKQYASVVAGNIGS